MRFIATRACGPGASADGPARQLAVRQRGQPQLGHQSRRHQFGEYARGDFVGLARQRRDVADLARVRDWVSGGFHPAHPVWFHFHAATGRIATQLSVELFKNAIEVPGPHVEALRHAAADAHARRLREDAEHHRNALQQPTVRRP